MKQQNRMKRQSGKRVFPLAAILFAVACATTAPPAQEITPPPATSIPPSPSEVLGIDVGADSVLADWEQIGRYMSTLAAASGFVRLDTIGQTTLDRPLLLVTITAPVNQVGLSTIKQHQALLADPRRLDPELEDSLIQHAPAVVFINNKGDIMSVSEAIEIIEREIAEIDEELDFGIPNQLSGLLTSLRTGLSKNTVELELDVSPQKIGRLIKALSRIKDDYGEHCIIDLGLDPESHCAKLRSVTKGEVADAIYAEHHRMRENIDARETELRKRRGTLVEMLERLVDNDR